MTSRFFREILRNATAAMTRRISVPICTEIRGIRCTEISSAATITHPMIEFCARIGRFEPRCCRGTVAVRRRSTWHKRDGNHDSEPQSKRTFVGDVPKRRRGRSKRWREGTHRTTLEITLAMVRLHLDALRLRKPTPPSSWKVMSQDCWAFFDGC